MTIPAFTTISEGTHNLQDLAASLLRHRAYLPENIIETLSADDDDVDETDIQDAIDALNEHVPPYCSIEYLPSLGVWPCPRSLLEDEDVPKLDELPEDPVGLNAVVSDHGNVTLYDGNTEIWGVV